MEFIINHYNNNYYYFMNIIIDYKFCFNYNIKIKMHRNIAVDS